MAEKTPTSLSQTQRARNFIQSFSQEDQDLARRLIDEIHLVSYEQFTSELLNLIDNILKEEFENKECIAVYVEQKIWKPGGRIPGYFPYSLRGRAKGPNPYPVQQNKNSKRAGSEYLLAHLLASIETRYSDYLSFNLGPDQLRGRRAREIWIVTDSIGSGDRIIQMLESFWRVATIKSWHSYKLIRFRIVSFFCSKAGEKNIKNHKTSPIVNYVMSTPTIFNSFIGRERGAIKEFCAKYAPPNSPPYGYGDVGALIAFSHGCPNNAPSLLHRASRKRRPLFQAKRTIDLADHFAEFEQYSKLDQNTARLSRIQRLQSSILHDRHGLWLEYLLVLSCIDKGARTSQDISGASRLRIDHVEKILKMSRRVGWISTGNQLTHLGRREIQRLRSRRTREPMIVNDGHVWYYPTQLRGS